MNRWIMQVNSHSKMFEYGIINFFRTQTSFSNNWIAWFVKTCKSTTSVRRDFYHTLDPSNQCAAYCVRTQYMRIWLDGSSVWLAMEHPWRDCATSPQPQHSAGINMQYRTHCCWIRRSKRHRCANKYEVGKLICMIWWIMQVNCHSKMFE